VSSHLAVKPREILMSLMLT